MDLFQLIIEARQNNRIAQRELYNLYAKPMFLLCRQYTRDDIISEEMVVNGFIRFFRSLKSFRFVSEVATDNFVRRIMVNECIRYLRRHKEVALVVMEDIPEHGVPEQIIADITAKEIFVMIAQLPLGYRTVFNLTVLENKSHKEIADMLKISEKTSQSQFRRAKDLLQQMLIQKNKDYESRTTKENKEKAE